MWQVAWSFGASLCGDPFLTQLISNYDKDYYLYVSQESNR